MKVMNENAIEKLLSIKDLAEIFQYSVPHTKRSVITQEGFPTPIRMTEGGVPRWKQSEILAFIDSRKDR